MKNILIVFSNPVDGRIDEFNDWYTSVHIRDVMRMPGSIAVQRFALAETQPQGAAGPGFRYLAVYEIDDTLKCSAAHAVAMTPKLPMSTAFDLSSPAHYFRARSFVTADPVADDEGEVILALFDDGAAFDGAAALRAVGRDGLLSAAHLEVLGDQLIKAPPAHPHLGLFRLSEPDRATAAWPRLGIVREAPVVARFRPIIRRLTADAVVNANFDERHEEARARDAMGDRQHRLVFRDGVAVEA